MNIFKHEFKYLLKTILVWSLALSALAVFFLLMFPGFSKDIEVTKQLLSNLPEAVLKALEISVSTFFTVYGFYIYIFSFVLLFGSVLAMNLGVASVSKEDTGKTSDFLLSKPVSRSQVLLMKIVADLAALALIDLVFIVVVSLAAKAVADGAFSLKSFLLINLALIFVQLFFFSLGTLLSVILNRVKSVIAISLPIVFAFFIINMVGSVVGDKAVRYLTPFKFYDPVYILHHNSYEWGYMIVEAIFLALAIAMSFIIYNRKDIPSAS